MASKYNFDDAYSTDSFTDSDWGNIGEHVGLDVDEEEKTEEEKTDIDNGGSDIEDRIDNSGEDKGESSKCGTGNKDIAEGSEGENSETDYVKELRQEMKELRRILKKGRVQLADLDENDVDRIEETYKEFKVSSRRVKKRFKALLYEDGNKSRSAGQLDNIPVDAKNDIPVDAENGRRITRSSSKSVNDGSEGCSKSADAESEMPAGESPSKPSSAYFRGQQRYNCPSCDFVGRSMGRTYSHMVDKHNATTLRCERCDFSTKNPTSLHNHRTRYCRKRDQ